MGKKKSRRGANLRGVGCPTNSRKRPSEHLDDSDPDRDEDDPPEDSLQKTPPEDSDDDAMDVDPEEMEPGEKRCAHRKRVLAADGPAGLARLDAQAERQRRSRHSRAEAKDRSVQTSIEDAADGTLLAKKLAQELEPEDTWATPAVAVAEAVATDSDGQRLVCLGEATEAAEQGVPPPVVEVRPRIGRPPGSSTKPPAARYASHKGLSPGSTGNPTTSKASRKAAREAAAAMTQSANGGGAPGEPPAKRRADADTERGPQLLPQLRRELSHLGDRLLAIASARRFKPTDFVGGEILSRDDWVELRESSWELRRVYAMAHFVALQRSGQGVVAACKQAAEAVRLGKSAHGVTFRAVHDWLTEYITNKGRITPSRRGCHTSTESFLSDESIKETALEWLRRNVRSAQPKGSKESPLNVPR
mgnify:CR=1 FL=1